MSPRILVAALATLLADALDQAETWHLANGHFAADLRALRARVERELETHSGRRRLRLADDPDASVADD
jgi:hypothetical protein